MMHKHLSKLHKLLPLTITPLYIIYCPSKQPMSLVVPQQKDCHIQFFRMLVKLLQGFYRLPSSIMYLCHNDKGKISQMLRSCIYVKNFQRTIVCPTVENPKGKLAFRGLLSQFSNFHFGPSSTIGQTINHRFMGENEKYFYKQIIINTFINCTQSPPISFQQL